MKIDKGYQSLKGEKQNFGGSKMSKNKKTEEVENTEETTVETPKVDIIRGRIPLATVAVIRFGEDAEATESGLAKKYRTTAGKISDIKKNRNFGYITEAFKPTQEMVDAANGHADQLGDAADDVKSRIASLGVASEEDVKAFEEVKASTRKPRGEKKDDAADVVAVDAEMSDFEE